MFQSLFRNIGWQNQRRGGAGDLQGAVEQLEETFIVALAQTVFNTTKNFQGVPSVSIGSDLMTFGYNVTGTNQITFNAGIVDEGAEVTITYLAIQ